MRGSTVLNIREGFPPDSMNSVQGCWGLVMQVGSREFWL